MELFENDQLNLFEIKKSDKKVIKKNNGVFESEKKMQTLFEENLKEILDINFIVSEYPTDDGKIDTLGVDNNGVPCIIEYKKENNGGRSILNQGIRYLRWFKKHKDHRYGFERSCKEKDKNIEINWKCIRIICIAGFYGVDDIEAAMECQSDKTKKVSLYCYSKHNNILSLYLLVDPKAKKSKGTHVNQSNEINKSIVENNLDLFLYKGKEIISMGKYKNEEFWVLAGSKVCKETTDYYRKGKEYRMERLEEAKAIEHDDYYELKKDISFRSPSAAASFCFGNQRDGNKEWKDKNKRNLKDIIYK